MNATHDPALPSFVPVPPDSEFPVQNLPYGVFRCADQPPRAGVRIGDFVLDLHVLETAGCFEGIPGAESGLFTERSRGVLPRGSLNTFMSAGRSVWHATRTRISTLLQAENPQLRDDQQLRRRALIPLEQATLCLPVEIGDYTDFYSSKQHAYNVGCMFRDPANALPPNYLWMPIGYHGRASSIVLSGADIRRPCGQIKSDTAEVPTFGPSRLLDFELEMGFLIGPGNTLGEPIPVARAYEHIFGLVLVNDWSARDIQKWEYVPLGPFLGKNFATSISPWIVPLAALEPFRCASPQQDPEPLDYLKLSAFSSSASGGSPAGHSFDIVLEVALQTPGQSPHVICRSNAKHLYWTMAQQLAHHAVNGCNLRTGDLLASGTISGPTPDSYGSLLELTWRGTQPLRLPSGEERKFLQDSDTVVMRAWCQGQGYKIGFGECRGTILPARRTPD
jgi:fumarylacetoacetase